MNKADDVRVFCELTGEREMPRFAWLLGRLAALNPPFAKEHLAVTVYHAHQIYGHLLALHHRGDNTAIQIRGTARPRAKRFAVDRGTAQELKRLRRVAQGRSDKRYVTAWLAMPGAAISMIGWKPGPPHKRRGGFEIAVRGHHAIIPTRSDALPLIEAALQRLEATPAEDRRKRKADGLVNDFVGAVRIAHRVIVQTAENRHGNGLDRLGCDINERFECDFTF